MTLKTNDPRLTAYVLGELDESEKSAIEAELERSPRLQSAVDQIRSTTELVAESLRAEPAPSLRPGQRARIEQAASEPASAMVGTTRKHRPGRLFAVSTLAACLLVAVTLGLYVLPRVMDRASVARQDPNQGAALETPDSGTVTARKRAAGESEAETAGQTETGPIRALADTQRAHDPFGRYSLDSPLELTNEELSESYSGYDDDQPGPADGPGMGDRSGTSADQQHAPAGMMGLGSEMDGYGDYGGEEEMGQRLGGYGGGYGGYGGAGGYEEAEERMGGYGGAGGMGGMAYGGYEDYGEVMEEEMSGMGTMMGDGRPRDLGRDGLDDDDGMEGYEDAPEGADQPGRGGRDERNRPLSSMVLGQDLDERIEIDEEPYEGNEDYELLTPREEEAGAAANGQVARGLGQRGQSGRRRAVDHDLLAPTETPPVSGAPGSSSQPDGSDPAMPLGVGERSGSQRSGAEPKPAAPAGIADPAPDDAEGQLERAGTTVQLTEADNRRDDPRQRSGEAMERARPLGSQNTGSASATQAGGASATQTESEVSDPQAKPTGRKPTGITTWRRARATPNASRLMIGDRDELPLEGVQANVQIDGFRARVILDYYFYNDRDQRYEGTFRLRLPNGASLYFFAFGESTFRYRPEEREPIRDVFLMASHRSATGNSPEEILGARASTWTAPKVARVVPKEKAAHAYRQTVRRRVDPALVEWSGAGIFSARVFPLAAKKLHRIVVGYDVDLTRVDDDLQYRLDLPEVNDCTVDLNLAAWAGGSASVTPKVEPFMSGGRALYRFDNPQDDTILVHLEDPGTVLLHGADEKTGDYFAASFRPDLPEGESESGSSTAVFLLDTSLSSNPDKFNVWLKLIRAVLESNQNSIQQFAVLAFNIEAHWWQEKFVPNTPENTQKLLDYANTLSLEGATDLGRTLGQAAAPSWFSGEKETERWDVFLLSDGALNWGDTNLHALTARLTGESSHAGAFFAYRTGMAGTEGSVLDMLARATGGAVFSVVGEAEIAGAGRAHRTRPWQLEEVELDGGRDLLVAGRPTSVFPGQRLLLAGRGRPDQEAPLVLTLRRGSKKETIRIKPDRVMKSELAPRVYGQVAVGQLELFADQTQDMSVSYARHFRVPGRTCSLLMLESEADYRRFDIKPEDDQFVVKSSAVSQVLNTAIDETNRQLDDPKAAFQAWLQRMETMPGMTFRMSPALKLAIQSLPVDAFRVEPKPLLTGHRTWDGVPSELKENLSEGEVEYDAIQAEARRRLDEYGKEDALRVCSSLVENSPGDLVLVRDVAYSALEWELPDQAYHLLHRVAVARPYEPQMYLAMAQALAELDRNDLALLYYEVALTGTWDNRFDEFHRIVSFDYLQFLREVLNGSRKTHLDEYASARMERVSEDVSLDKADLVVTMIWNTDGTDVDMHVLEPTGEECYYQNRRTRIGGELTPDCTEGFGPEMYVLPRAKTGKYRVQVKYFASDTNRAQARTKVYAIIYRDWGTKERQRTRKAVTLEQDKQMHDVATIGITL